jgi:hypothetical protein
MTDKYLRGRPFLVVEFTQRPRAKVNTKVKGWMNDPANLQTFEHVSIVDRVNDKQMRAALVIDIIDGKAIRNATGKDDEGVIAHYIGRYAEKIKAALQMWAQDQIAKGMVQQAVEAIYEKVETEDYIFPPEATGRGSLVQTLPTGETLSVESTTDAGAE